MTITRLNCAETVWGTPPHVVEAVRKYFGGTIPLDPCTEPDNPTEAAKFFTKEDDGLVEEWLDSCFVNPPYGKELRQWVQKIAFEAATGTEILFLCSISSRFETAYWHQSILTRHQNAEVIFNKRVQFYRPVEVEDGPREWKATKRNAFASIMLGFNVDVLRFVDAFQSLGCVRLTQNFVVQ